MTASSSSWRAPAIWFLATAALAGGCDLSTKGWAEQALAHRPGQSLPVVEPWLELSLAYNRGTAFSIIPHLGDTQWFFAVLAVVVCVALLMAAVRHRPFRLWPVVALGIAAGGALGNGYDRIFRSTPEGGTGVVDFIRVNFTETLSWPTFNLADVWIFVGVVGMLLWGWLHPEPAAERATGATGT